jgi:N-acetyl-anhydromuramyl-L-alanine amidase AmpD
MSDTVPLPAQPGPLPVIDHSYRADQHHYTENRTKPIGFAVIHNTEGVDSRAWLSTTPGSGVSIHVLVDRAGVRWNIVDYNDTAWHVGNATPPYSNANCLGLEFENRSNAWGVVEPYPEAQLNTAAHCVATWEFSYGIPWYRVVRHGDIAVPYGRRHDPSNLDMNDFHARIAAWLAFFRSLPPSEHAKYII